MPTPTPTPEPLGTRAAPGGPSTATLSVATVVAIGLVGALFYLARGPLSVALGLPLAEHAPIDAASESPDAPAAAPLAAEPREATVRQVDPRWNLLKVQRALEAGGEAVEALIPQARTELAQLDPLDDADPVRAARAQRRFDAWGRTWINRLRAVARG